MAIALFFLVHWHLSVFCQTFFLHRYGAHSQFTMGPRWQRFFYLLTYVSQGASFLHPRAYAILHRMHHAYSDTERDPHSPILMRYVQSPIMAGEQTLCEATGDQSLCGAAAALGDAQLRGFPAAANHGPQYDAVYLQWMLYQYAQDHDSRWYALAYYNAKRALANSGNKAGLFLQDWDGDHAPSDSR